MLEMKTVPAVYKKLVEEKVERSKESLEAVEPRLKSGKMSNGP